MKKVLSIDGGGFRGLIPAFYLADNNIDIKDFDLVVGTSAGGLLALALASGMPPRDIADFYESLGRKVFRKPALVRAARMVFGLGSQYSVKPLRQSIASAVGEKRMSDALIPVLVTAHDLASGQAVWFHENTDYSMMDAALATSAAPTYFPPHTVGDMECVDGGLYMNSPSDIGFAAARKLWPSEPVEVLSLGTGYTEGDLKVRRPWHPVGWVRRVIHVCLNGSAQVAGKKLQYIPSCEYTRVNFPLDKDYDMDDVRRKTIEVYREAAKQWRETER